MRLEDARSINERKSYLMYIEVCLIPVHEKIVNAFGSPGVFPSTPKIL